MKPLHKILNDYSPSLDKIEINNNRDKLAFLSKLKNCDVTRGKYTRFLLECYLDKTIRDEDLSGGLEGTVGKTISLFHYNKNKIPEQYQYINRYTTVVVDKVV